MEPRAQQPRPSSNSPTSLNLSSKGGPQEVPQTSTDTQFPSMITESTCTHGFNSALKTGGGAQGQAVSFLGNIWHITVSPEPNAFSLTRQLWREQTEEQERISTLEKVQLRQKYINLSLWIIYWFSFKQNILDIYYLRFCFYKETKSGGERDLQTYNYNVTW
jgi:hypothetical protein